MSETGDKCQQFLRDARFAGYPVLCLGKKREECHNLFAEKLGFSCVCEAYG